MNQKISAEVASSAPHADTNVLTGRALLVGQVFPVFPLQANKRPFEAGGFKTATHNADEIRRRFADLRAALIGVPTGEPSGLCVVDIDPEGLPWLEANKHRLPVTRTQHTRRGGYHLVFR